MPRYRKLHVKTVESLDINDMPDDFTRLLWVLLPLALCREGRGVDNVAWIKSRVFPMRLDVTGDMIASAMDWYEQRSMIKRYEAEGRGYFYVPTFPKYQGNTAREAETNYPPPPEQQPQPVESESGLDQEPVENKSTSDAVCNMQYADAPAQDPHAPTGGRHPAFAIYEQLSGQIITAKIQMDDILEFVPRDDASITRWGEVVRAWIGMGWKPRNITGMLDHFREGRIPGQDYAARGPPVPVPKQEPVVVSSAAFNATPGVE